MDEEQKSIVTSLGGDSEEILEYLPYLLQDLWELGGGTDGVLEFLDKNLSKELPSFNVLELCCGKGPLLINLVKKFNCHGTGIDLFTPFIIDAKDKAKEYGVEGFINFRVMDIIESVKELRDFDLVIYGGDTDVLGSEMETLEKVSRCCCPGGYLLYETASNSMSGVMEKVKESGFELIDKSILEKERVKEINAFNNEKIIFRVQELVEKFPAKKELFENYIKQQKQESYELENNLEWFRLLLKVK